MSVTFSTALLLLVLGLGFYQVIYWLRKISIGMGMICLALERLK